MPVGGVGEEGGQVAGFDRQDAPVKLDCARIPAAALLDFAEVGAFAKHAALIVAKRLRDSLRTSMFCQEEGLNLNVRASMGVATYPHDGKDPRDIIRQADEMMYLVKNTTRDNIGIAQRGVMK